MPATSEIQSKFLSSPFYAVIGASKDETKYGTKILKWYKARDLTVTPLHPKESELQGISALKSIADLPSPQETSISIVTPPKVTLGALALAKEHGIPALWIQPGAEDEAVINYIKENNLEDRVILGGPCILVDGDDIRESLKSNL
ncbi:NAD-P-binding protein [Coprinopsis marcescibilis]|uniref:NAD-P-binding protein n=1 Tax=Coprinopsis marcescibilis TaxID=230819 RepID=A0A5C3KY25_COPMA|nr:NAD-P-binding protein [Coprinopsis marcescibilis]